MTSGEALQSRMRVINLPILPPGKCAVCGAVDKKVVDTGTDVEWYGRIYFCEDCGIQIGTVFGMRLGIDYAQLRVDLQLYKQHNDEIISALRKLADDTNNVVTSGLTDICNLLRTEPGTVADSEETVPGPEQSNADVGDSFKKSDDSSSAKFEPFSFQGSLGLPDVASSNSRVELS